MEAKGFGELTKFYVLINKIDGHESPYIFFEKEKAKKRISEMQEEYWEIVERRLEDMPMYEPNVQE